MEVTEGVLSNLVNRAPVSVSTGTAFRTHGTKSEGLITVRPVSKAT
ncbi:MAG: hypothetical protein RLZ97_1533 [Verrucomicrobiota bacterium]|jgi:hypothetical protein